MGALGDLPSLCNKKWICLYLKEEMVLSQTKEEEEAVSSLVTALALWLEGS